jgi:hypothetical protein
MPIPRHTFLTRPSSLIFILLCLGTGWACVKEEADVQPVADFSFDKSEYVEGDTVKLINRSTNAGSYHWTLPDGTGPRTENASFPTEILSTDRTVQVKLEAVSPKRILFDWKTKEVRILAGKGQLVIYQDFYDTAQVELAFDMQTLNSTLLKTTAEPNCGQSGHPTYNLKSGNHLVHVKINGLAFTQLITITQNQCVRWKLL